MSGWHILEPVKIGKKVNIMVTKEEKQCCQNITQMRKVEHSSTFQHVQHRLYGLLDKICTDSLMF